MQNTTKKPLEMAIIFKSSKNTKGVYIYKPVDIVLGYFDEENTLFYTRNGDAYHFLPNYDYLYTFGLRTPVSELNINRNKTSLKEFAHQYLNQLKQYYYHFQMDSANDYKSLKFVAIDKKTKQKLIISDQDVEKWKKEVIAASRLNFDTKQLKAGIKSEVIGQDEAIDNIVSVIWQNFRSDNSKSNILLIGSTGVGKTEIMRNIAKRLDIPMVIMNATNLSPTAYQGPSIDHSLKTLLEKANYDINKASRGIVFIDEIDKKANTDSVNNDGIITGNIQDELLNLLEDGEYQIVVSDNGITQRKVTLNTKHITFICAGAFSLMKEKKTPKKENVITGFTPISDKQTKQEESTNHITHDDLIKYGLKSELVGRFNNIIQLNPLNKDNLITIMKNPNNKTIQEKINILQEIGVQTKIEEEVYQLLADKALEKGSGARGLTTVVDGLFDKAMQEVADNQDSYKELIITKDTIDNPKKYTLIKKK